MNRSHPADPRRAPRREVVLVGGGHTHVQVLRRFAMEPPPRSRLTVILDTPVAVYSGMVPGFVAGHYRGDELEIDVVPLARRARARVVLARAVGVDARGRRIEVEGRPPIRYDVASLDIGSTVAGLELPGVAEHGFPTRPIGRFVERLDRLVERARARPRPRIVVVGGGAGGVELAFCLRERLAAAGVEARLTLLENGARILPRYASRLVARVHRNAERRGIEIRVDSRVEAAAADAVLLAGGERLPCDALVWVAGAVSQPIFRDSGLPTDERGFLKVRSTLQSQAYDDLFAVGDCATLIAHPRTPKAGVYAVRQGPYLADNLLAFLEGSSLRSYEPQGDFLTLLNLGDGRALGAKWGLSFEGAWVMKLKDRIDRRFVHRFQVLGRGGEPKAELEGEAPMPAAAEMLCGGCAAKVGRTALHRVLERLGPPPTDGTVALGLAVPDDAAAWTAPGGGLVVTSVDAFRAFTDDPYLVGRVAAVNALSDLQAKGVAPRYALALVALPQTEHEAAREETLFQVLAGVRAALDPLGVSLVGGHSTTTPELLVGLTVEGPADGSAPLLAIDALEAGQALVLSKALGTGVLFRADAQGRARGPWIQAALDSMLRDNGAAARTAVALGATAATDVTGFGLAGHLAEMARASGVAAVIETAAVPALPGALELLAGGLRSTSHGENERLRGAMRAPEGRDGDPRQALLFDPQTSGGLLFGVAPEIAGEAVERLQQTGDRPAAIVGWVTDRRTDDMLIEVV